MMNDSIMESDLPVTATIINFRTPDLLKRTAESLRKYYPNIPVLLIDNGSGNGSAGAMETIRQQNPAHTEVIINDENLHHGPAMDQALRHLRSRYVLFLDSDVEIRGGGFLELMVKAAEEHPGGYAVGHCLRMNKRGFDVPSEEGGTPYIRPYCMLIQRDLYLTLPSFQRHGTPCLANMKAAVDRGLTLVDFSVCDYVAHEGRGTAGRFGYQLGVRGKFNYVMNKLGW